MAIPVSKAFEQALKHSHTIAVKVEIYHDGDLKATLTKVTGGYITIKRSDENRRSAYITVTDDTGSITPDGTIDSTINIYNCDMKLYRGITFPDGLVELVSLGMFEIKAIEIAESGQGLYLKITGADFSRKIQRATLTSTFTINQGTNAVAAIQQLLTSRFSRITYGQVDSTYHALPSLAYGSGSDAWEAATKLASSIGYDLYFDNEGMCVIKPAIDPLTRDTDWEYVEGETCTMLSQQKYFDSDEAWNWVVVTGQNAGTTIIRADAKDNNPNSPTFVGGRYGPVVKTIASSDINSQAQAQAMADRELRLALGGPEMLYLVTVVNPALDIDDVLYVKRAKAKTDDYYILDQVTLPLQKDAAANVGIRKRVSPHA